MSEPYRNATELGKHLMTLILACKEPCKEAALLMREWRETEQMKRDWRGLPRLAPSTLKEIMAAKREQAKTIDMHPTTPAYTEPD